MEAVEILHIKRKTDRIRNEAIRQQAIIEANAMTATQQKQLMW